MNLVDTWNFHPLVVRDDNSPSQRIANRGLILRVLVGSGVHGTAIEGQDDIDEMGVCVEPPRTVTGLDHFSHYQWRSQPEGVRSGPGDLDLIVYGLRRYLSLVMQGNATVILPLFVPDEHVAHMTSLGQELRENTDRLISKAAGPRFLGYLNSQREGLLGIRTGARNRGRADIIERYGYDTKFAMHAIRLGVQGIELMETGRFSAPLAEPMLTRLRGVRAGEYAFGDVIEMIRLAEEQLKASIADSPLPEQPDRAWVNDYLYTAHQWYWTHYWDMGT